MSSSRRACSSKKAQLRSRPVRVAASCSGADDRPGRVRPNRPAPGPHHRLPEGEFKVATRQDLSFATPAEQRTTASAIPAGRQPREVLGAVEVPRPRPRQTRTAGPLARGRRGAVPVRRSENHLRPWRAAIARISAAARAARPARPKSHASSPVRIAVTSQASDAQSNRQTPRPDRLACRRPACEPRERTRSRASRRDHRAGRGDRIVGHNQNRGLGGRRRNRMGDAAAINAPSY